MLIRCKVGCLLKRIASPSIICLCTISPSSSTIELRSILRKVIDSPFFFSKIFAPGHSSGPFCTNFVKNALFILLTVTGLVIFLAIFIGIPNSRIEIFGSAVITERALKSTRFAIKLPLIRPPLPFKRSLIDFKGRPERCATDATPGILLST